MQPGFKSTRHGPILFKGNVLAASATMCANSPQQNNMTGTKTRYLPLLTITATLFMGRLTCGAQLYTLTNLGPGNFTAINDSGQVLGSDSLGSFTYQNGIRTYLPRTFTGRALNNAGEVAGYLSIQGPYDYLLATYQAGTVTNTGFGGLAPIALNDKGQIVGAEVTAYQGFFYNNGALTTVGPLPYAVNNNGAAVGGTLANNRQPFIYQNGQLTYLAPPNAVSAEAYVINDAGMVAGLFSARPNFSEGQIFIYQNGVYQEPGYALNASIELDSVAGINNAGLLVGNAETATNIFPWSYDPALGFSNLNNDINAPGWVLRSTADINNHGQILGTGVFNGQADGFILTPVPEPRAWSLMLAGFAALAFVIKTRRTLNLSDRTGLR